MAFKDLDIPEMVDLLAPYIHDPKSKKRFLSIVEIAGFYELTTQAYQGVLSVRPPDTSKDEEIQRISAAQKPIDYRHDRLASCTARAIECRIEHALSRKPPNTAEADRWGGVWTRLFPEGTRIINASYRAESGNTLRVKQLLESEEGKDVVAALKTVVVHSSEKKGEAKDTLFDIVQQWIAAGAELGALEAEKAARLASLSATPPPELLKVQAARSKWIAIVNMILEALKWSSAPLEDRVAIRHPLESAAEKAGRSPAAPPAEAPETPPAPETASGAESGAPGGGGVPFVATETAPAAEVAAKPAGGAKAKAAPGKKAKAGSR